MTPRLRGVPLALFLWACGALRAGAGETVFTKETHVYKTVGDCAIRADVYRPAGGDNRPVLLWIHGGALIFGDRAMLPREQMLRYVGAGYVVVSIDYRLAPESELPAILEDVDDAHRWVREKGPTLFRADPSRIAVVGHSAGGYLALMAGVRLSPRPRALVSFYGYGDIAGPWYSRPDPHYNREPRVSPEAAARAVGARCISEGPEEARFPFYVYCRQRGLWPKEVTGRDPDAEPRAFDPWCPLRNVSGAYPPTLLVHGDKDTDVPYEQSVLMGRELERRGVVHELVTLEGRDHVFDITGEGLRDPTVSAAFDRVISFLARRLAPSLSPEAVGRIDAHAHVSAVAPALYALLERLNMRMVNVCVVDRYEPGYETVEPQHAMARRLESASRGRIRWISTFDEIDWESPGFADRVIADLDATFREGALGVKIYKSIGMELRSRVVYATDLGIYPDQDPEAAVRQLEAEYARDWAFLATDGVVEYQGRRIPGLALPETVLRKLYRENALRVVPGLLGAEAAAR